MTDCEGRSPQNWRSLVSRKQTFQLQHTTPRDVTKVSIRQRYEPFALDTSFIRPEDYAHIFEIDLFKDPAGHLLLAALDAVKSSGYTYNSMFRAGKEEGGLSELIEYLSDETNTAGSFERTTVRALRSRLQSLDPRRTFFINANAAVIDGQGRRSHNSNVGASCASDAQPDSRDSRQTVIQSTIRSVGSEQDPAVGQHYLRGRTRGSAANDRNVSTTHAALH